MTNYIIDHVTNSDGALTTLGAKDIIVGLTSDDSKIIILRYNYQRS